MANHRLKITAWLMASAASLAIFPASAAVSLISVQHRVWGLAGSASYDQTSSSPLSQSATESPNFASSTANDWSINAYASNENAYEAVAQAQNTYLFTPLSNEISISLNGVIGVWWFENSAKLDLKHVPSDSLVSSYRSPSYSGISPFSGGQNDMVSYPFSWNTTLDLVPGDTYELIIHVAAARGEGGDGSSSLNLSIVPEPGVPLLACIAALFICVRRSRS